MDVLVDTSVWVDHFRHGSPRLIEILHQDRVLTHPMVVLELACGTPPAPREQTLNYLSTLKSANQSSNVEVMAFIEREVLYGLGCGLVDLSLLASTLLTPDAVLWTLDKRLMGLAVRFGVDYRH